MEQQMIRCPLMGKDIEEAVCFDIHMVAEGMAPVNTAPREAVRDSNYKEICLKCKNHR